MNRRRIEDARKDIIETADEAYYKGRVSNGEQVIIKLLISIAYMLHATTLKDD